MQSHEQLKKSGSIIFSLDEISVSDSTERFARIGSGREVMACGGTHGSSWAAMKAAGTKIHRKINFLN